MKDKIKNVIRMLTGGELGYTNEGNVQWYYMMSMVISSLVIWRNDSNIAMKFMLLSVLHFALSYIYGSVVEEEKNKKWISVVYVITNLIIILSALIINPAVTFLSFTFTVFMVCVAYVMDIFAILRRKSFLPAVLNLLVFVAFFICVLIAPMPWYGKIICIIAEFIIHPVIDHLQGFIPPVTELADIAWRKTFK